MNDHEHNHGTGLAKGTGPEEGAGRRAGSSLTILPSDGAATPRQRLEPAEVRERLKGTSGRTYWRSLEELAQTEEFEDMLHREFPRQASEWDEGVSRRRFLQLSAAGLSLAGLTACTRQPPERIVPYVDQPEDVTPGRALYFATAGVEAGFATGFLVESQMGRPIKVEGNPDHPASLGSTSARAQAGVLDLYDPDRSDSVRHLGRPSQWPSFTAALEPVLTAQESLGGEDLRILTGTVTSPSLAAQMESFQKRFPKARWHQWEPAAGVAAEGARLAFGEPLNSYYDLSKAQVILCLDADLLGEGPAQVRYARDFAAGRKAQETGNAMSRLYVVESTPTQTGATADHRLPLSGAEIGHFALALAAELGVAGARRPSAALSETAERWVKALAEDLAAHRGTSVVAPGDYTSPALWALAMAINETLGNLGSTVLVTDPVVVEPEGGAATLADLVEDMNAGKVQALVILGSNPIFTAPAALEFAKAIQQVPLRVHQGLYADETAEYCHWHIPESHWLEGWSDARAFDGTVTIVQPLIEPLYESYTAQSVVAQLVGAGGSSAYELVQKHWQGQGMSDAAWRKALNDGLVAGSALAPRAAGVSGDALARAVAQLDTAAEGTGLELHFRPDASAYDGRYANNGWLQELPRPLTKLTWDNALMISAADVERLGLAGEMSDFHILPEQLKGEEKKAAHLLSASGRMVRLTVDGQSLEVPLWVLPGQAEGTVTLHLGYGRRRAGSVGTGVGFDASQVRSADGSWSHSGATLERLGDRHELASTQLHQNIPVETQEADKRHLVRSVTLADFVANPGLIAEMGHAEDEKYSFMPGYEYDEYRWGMVIDLNSCIGCSACVVACQAENNIPVVGKEQVKRGREMHWIRVDRYYSGGLKDPAIYSQPVPCMQCEQAPCELVCPVGATVHNQHGLNDMVYNRCVGTRYCSNNCP
ncbi:MAG: TAT-variant-translocated molybdopterin oxidoreductase, partial [Acidobacteria bacterium]|nr:TAT-variant-translocated molybdopterin oxidoreductase [Acidobacteriota bacterium]